MQAIGLLEQTWSGSNRNNIAMTTEAYKLLSGVNSRMTPQAKSAWRWRLLLLRAQSDALTAEQNGKLCGPLLCKIFAEIAFIQHTGNSSRCGIPQVPCTCAPPPAPSAAVCPSCAFPKPFVPWIRAEGYSNVYGVVAHKTNRGIPFLGTFQTEDGCQKACIALSNCTQYSWAGNNKAEPQWAGDCYGRCDAEWKLTRVPCDSGVCGVSARRVEAAFP